LVLSVNEEEEKVIGIGEVNGAVPFGPFYTLLSYWNSIVCG